MRVVELYGVHVDTQFAGRPGDNPEQCIYTSHIIVSDIGQVHSDIVTCGLCFSVDWDVATFICPSSLNINDGYANNSKANTSLKLISRDLASRPMSSA